MSNKTNPTEEELKQRLSPEEYHVCRERGTEPAFTGQYWDLHDKGMFRCKVCGAELFDSETKFESGTGWPSFWAPAAEDRVETEEDRSHGMRRVEVHCARCGSHLGHVFTDGPRPTGLRYCVNSASLQFEKK